ALYESRATPRRLLFCPHRRTKDAIHLSLHARRVARLRNQDSSHLITNVAEPNARLASFPPMHHGPTSPASRQRRRRSARNQEGLRQVFPQYTLHRKAV